MTGFTRPAIPAFEVHADRSIAGLGQVRPTGELDLAAVPMLLNAVDEALVGAPIVLLDLGSLTFCDSSGIHAVLEADIRARNLDARLVVLPGNATVHRTFELTGADRLLQIIGEPAPDSN